VRRNVCGAQGVAQLPAAVAFSSGAEIARTLSAPPSI
jgi:hypothetical protein